MGEERGRRRQRALRPSRSVDQFPVRLGGAWADWQGRPATPGAELVEETARSAARLERAQGSEGRSPRAGRSPVKGNTICAAC